MKKKHELRPEKEKSDITGFKVFYDDDTGTHEAEYFYAPKDGEGAILIVNASEGIHVRGHGTAEQIAVMIYTFMAKDGHEDILLEFANLIKNRIERISSGSTEIH